MSNPTIQCDKVKSAVKAKIIIITSLTTQRPPKCDASFNLIPPQLFLSISN